MGNNFPENGGKTRNNGAYHESGATQGNGTARENSGVRNNGTAHGSGAPEAEPTYLLKKPIGIFQIVFSRTTLAIIFMVLQLFLLFAVWRWLGEHLGWFLGGSLLFSLVFAILILNTRTNPAFKISWIVLVFILPLFGVMLYLFSSFNWGYQALHRRLTRIEAETAEHFPANDELYENLDRPESRHIHNIFRYVKDYAGHPVYTDTRVEYFPLGEAMFESLLRRLEAARKFIFLEFFIIAESYMWGRILEVLERKAAEGVEVRVLYDGTVAVSLLPYNYPKRLRELGIRAKMFAPLQPFLSTHYNNRDHRKIVVIDGEIGYTGGINIADEYINRYAKQGHWKDTAVLLEGAAVRSLTVMFLQMWNIDEAVREDFTPYLSEIAASTGFAANSQVAHGRVAQGYVLPFAENPLNDERIGETVYLDMINNARDYIYIMSPYLVIDNEMTVALLMAAKRGVDVRLSLPSIPDHKWVYAMAHAQYPELIRGGVRIYEYTLGFVHGKMLISDDRSAIVGTINLDYRSLYHHFECAVYLYDVPIIPEIRADFEHVFAQSQLYTEEIIRRDGWGRRLIGRLLMIFAPLV